MPGFDEMAARLRALRAAAPEAAKAAVRAAQAPIFEASQDLCPVDTGLLKSTGAQHEPTIDGEVATGVISYGSADTVTPWHGVGYEVLVHTPGTRFYAGTPFLEQPALDAAADAPATMAEVFWKEVGGGL